MADGCSFNFSVLKSHSALCSPLRSINKRRDKAPEGYLGYQKTSRSTSSPGKVNDACFPRFESITPMMADGVNFNDII